MPNGDALDVTFNVWDEGQDVAAASEVLKNQTWECELAFSINVPVSIIGQTDTIISQPGSSSGVFAITKFEGSGTNLQLVATCTSPESGRQVFVTERCSQVYVISDMQNNHWEDKLLHPLPWLC